ncbi:protein tiptop [Lepeophtheirus salmonis]|uniref:protein tiptop n=1 Tax=Lepeophtheirus salmonis TaxID=72036 RepID=UPI001AE1DF52|nr:protein tiptop-like [Lepeophtheirus salmonis]
MTVNLAKMGRRKQNCPQKTGNNAPNAQNNQTPDEGSEETSLQEDNNTLESDSMSLISEKDAGPSLDSVEPPSSSSNGMAPPPPFSLHSSIANSNNGTSTVSGVGEGMDPMSLFKNPLFNPALLSLNPSLYAVQLAHLQAAQLLSQASSSSSDDSPLSRKRKMLEDNALGGTSKRPMSPKESPLDLTKDVAKGTFSPGKLDPFAAAALSPFFSPFLGARPEMLLPGTGASSSSDSNSFFKNNPLERMSEIIKGPHQPSYSHQNTSNNNNVLSNHHQQHSPSSLPSGGGTNKNTSGPRHSAWQSQWINRGPENSKDIFKCVWCKDAFSSLQDLTDHMKETKHFGPQIPSSSPPQISPGLRVSSKSTGHQAPPPPTPTQTTSLLSTSPSPLLSSPKTRDILKEQLPMPRKLVRGQDVWLGRGEQQTKDILKCMWCGQSFRSLDLMTKHMQETKHYTKVISQEQLSSWKSGGGGNESSVPISSPSPNSASSSSQQHQHNQSHVNSVLTCKVCDSSFSTLRDLSDHMVKNNHYNESKSGPNSRSVVSPPPPNLPPPSKEKRKKSLPVRKLLELERAQQEFIISGIKSDEGKITCEKCSEKIPVSLFSSHIHLCIGSGPSDLLRRPPSSSAASSTPPSISPSSTKQNTVEDHQHENESDKQPKSILGSLEKMVQSNFGASKKKSTLPVVDGNLSILQRLGIDESIPTDFSRPNNAEVHNFRPIPNFFMGGKFGTSSRSDSSECSSPDRSKLSNYPDSKEEESKTEERGGDHSGGGHFTKNSLPPSPAASQRSFQEYVNTREDEAATPNSLVESKMDESITSHNENTSSEDPGRKKNPLAALQMLCDKTEKPKCSSSSLNNNGGHMPTVTSASPSSILPVGTSSLYSDPGAILAFSWACNQAIVNDSLLKCPFCDTPFISKGAYRHHLSKMHFVKDEKGIMGSPFYHPVSKGPEKSPSPNESSSTSSSMNNLVAPPPPLNNSNSNHHVNNNNNSASSPSSSSAKAENAQSKFQKYSQLAKQLSCSSQP